MILVCGIPSEPPLARVLDRLEEIEAPTVVFNQREFASSRLSWSVTNGRVSGWLGLGGQNYDLTSVSGVYARLMDDRLLPELDDELTDSPLRGQCRDLHDQLVAWMDIAPCRVLNRVRNMGSNGSKPYQAQLIRSQGFETPETLITNDVTRATEFLQAHGRVVFKSISGVRSIVTELCPEALEGEHAGALRACPVQFQAYVEGFDVRVHTVGYEVFATRIHSPGVDYRYAPHGEDGTHLEPYELGRALQDRCVALSRSLGLPFAGIDLRITPDGRAVCFEVNPSPAYSYYESHTGQPISLAVARFLARRESGTRAGASPRFERSAAGR